jgi:hypothetical protein
VYAMSRSGPPAMIGKRVAGRPCAVGGRNRTTLQIGKTAMRRIAGSQDVAD